MENADRLTAERLAEIRDLEHIQAVADLLREVDALTAERDEAGNALARERAKPGGSWDAAAVEQMGAQLQSALSALKAAEVREQTLRDALERALPEIANASWMLEQAGEALLSGLLHTHHERLAAALAGSPEPGDRGGRSYEEQAALALLAAPSEETTK